MADESTLTAQLDDLSIPTTIDREWLATAVLGPLGIKADTRLADLVEDILLAQLSDDDSSFHMRPGGWRIDVAGTTAKAIICGSILAAALFLNGAQEIPAELLPAAVPLLIDVKRVRLDMRERELLLPLRQATRGIEGMAVSPRVLYNRLDSATQGEINYNDFAAFCTRLVEAGELDDAGLNDVRPRSAGTPAWIRITWT